MVSRSILQSVVRRLKRDETYTLDPALTSAALTRIIRERAMDATRGWRWRPFLRQAAGPFFVGRHVTIRHANMLSVGRSVTLEDYVQIDALSQQGVQLGDHVTIAKFVVIEATGVLTKLGKGFSMGDNSNLGDYCFVGAAGGVSIGRNVLIGQRVSFHSENHVFERTDIPMKSQGVTHQGIVVEDDCWLGAGSILLDGVTVGTGAVLAAGSVVTSSVPPFAVVGGVPARVLRMRKG